MSQLLLQLFNCKITPQVIDCHFSSRSGENTIKLTHCTVFLKMYSTWTDEAGNTIKCFVRLVRVVEVRLFLECKFYFASNFTIIFIIHH